MFINEQFNLRIMEILFEHAEDKKYNTYKSRGRYNWLLIQFVTLVLAIGSGVYFKLGNYSTAMYFFIPFLILFVLILKEVLPISKKRQNALKNGKRQFENGSVLRGNYGLKIEK